ncbi:MAG: hypothetical protein R2698_08710 [Microthrixaceae bacterium]
MPRPYRADPAGSEPGVWESYAHAAVEELSASDQRRVVRSVGRSGVHTTRDGREFVHFASNDYFGLSTHPAVVAAAMAAAREWGAGSAASRLVVGSRPPFDELEAAGRLEGAEDARSSSPPAIRRTWGCWSLWHGSAPPTATRWGSSAAR